MTAEDVLRLTLLAGLVGFVAFCASYAFTTWRRRNPSPSRRRMSNFFACLLLLGSVGAGAVWASVAFQERPGVLTGDDLFVIHARRDANLAVLVQEGQVQTETVIAKFVPASNEAELAIMDARIEEAKARIGTFDNRSLPVDPLLSQRRDQLQGQILQSKGFTFELIRAMRELERDQLNLRTTWTREESDMKGASAAAEAEAAMRDAQITIAEGALTRTKSMRSRELVPAPVIDERNTALLGLHRERQRVRSSIKTTETRLGQLRERYDGTFAAMQRQYEQLQANLERENQNIAALSQERSRVEVAIGYDQERARAANAGEQEVVRFQLAALQSDRRRLVSTTQVRAPFDGNVVYRHPAPGLVPEGTPILAVSSGSGFSAAVRMSQADAVAVAQAGPVAFTTNQPLLNRFFTGTYRSHTAPADRDEVVAYFTVVVPADAIMMLAASNTKLLPANLQWYPPMVQKPLFLGLVSLMILGALGLTLSLLGGGGRQEVVLTRPQPVGALPPPTAAVVYARAPRTNFATRVLAVSILTLGAAFAVHAAPREIVVQMTTIYESVLAPRVSASFQRFFGGTGGAG